MVKLASYVSRILFKSRLILSRINGPNFLFPKKSHSAVQLGTDEHFWYFEVFLAHVFMNSKLRTFGAYF